ncbi:MAG: hypothetical protein O3C17_26695, partial [Planctomycetota bacterium]|nr:hypothetical protein [Planctomycetota bacterium]
QKEFTRLSATEHLTNSKKNTELNSPSESYFRCPLSLVYRNGTFCESPLTPALSPKTSAMEALFTKSVERAEVSGERGLQTVQVQRA